MQCKSSSTDLSANRVHQSDCKPTRSQKRAIGNSKTSAGTKPINKSQTKNEKMMKVNQSDRTSLNCKRSGLIVLVIALNLAPLSTLAFNFNYQLELAQTNQHQPSLSQQAFNGLNHNTFYQPPANQFVPGQQFFNNQAFAQTVQLKPQQQIGGGSSQLLNPPPSAPNVDVSGIAGQLDEPQRDFTNSYSLDAASEAGVFTESNRVQSNGSKDAPSSPPPQATLATTRKPSEQLATSQSATTMAKRQLTPVERQEAATDHEVVRSAPSPSGKILEVVGRDSSVVSATPIAREQPPTPSATTSSTTTTTTSTTTTTAAPNTAPANQRRHVLKPVRHNAAAFNNKDPLKTAEQQIIDQHARAGLSRDGQVDRQRLERTTTAPQYLMPNSYRDSNNKLVGSLLSTLLNYNSATTSVSGGQQDGGDSSLLKLSSSAADRQKTGDGEGLLSSLTSNFRSGISSRTSVVKAAMGDNKLARTITSLGKTIGGNKYVAGAGIAAALAALGLTVGKLMSPHVMMGSNYEKLGGSGFDQLTSGSMVLPTLYDQTSSRPLFYPGGESSLQLGGQSQYGTDSLMAAANTLAGYESGSYDSSLYSQQASSFPVNSWQQQQQIANIRPTRPTFSQTTVSPFLESANGHYSSYYSNQPNSEQFSPSSGDTYSQPSQLMTDINTSYNYDQQPHQFLQPRYGSYVSGAPSQSIPTATLGSQHFYSSQDRGHRMPSVYFDSSSSNGGVGSIQFNADQITASASSDAPTFPDQPQPIRTLADPNQRRSGTMSSKLNEVERNLLNQQVELLKRSRQQSNRFVVAGGSNQSTKSSAVSQQQFITSTSLLKAPLEPVGGGRGGLSGLHVNDSTKSWNTNNVESSGTELLVGQQAKQMKQQQQFVIRYPPVQTVSSDNLGGQPIRVVSSPQMQKNRGEATRAPAYLIASNQTKWQASGPGVLEKRPRQWSSGSRLPPRVVADAAAIEPVAPAPEAGQSSGWQSLEATRQQVATATAAANALEAAKKSLPQEASDFDSPVAVATDDESELDDGTQEVNENNNSNKSEVAAGDKTTRLRRVTRFEPLDSGPAANLSAEAFSIPLEDFFSRHMKRFESSSTTSSGETKSGQPSGRPQEKSDARGNDVEIGHSGGKYQIDADGNSFESATTTSTSSGAADRSRDKANKLIESTVADNAAVSVPSARPIVTGVGSTSTTQHDNQHHKHHQYHNHRPQPDSDGDQLAQTDNDNVVVELLPAATTGERRADYEDNNSNGDAGGKQRDAQPVGGHRVVGQLDELETTNDKRRSFLGLVAGSIGAS